MNSIITIILIVLVFFALYVLYLIFKPKGKYKTLAPHIKGRDYYYDENCDGLCEFLEVERINDEQSFIRVKNLSNQRIFGFKVYNKNLKPQNPIQALTSSHIIWINQNGRRKEEGLESKKFEKERDFHKRRADYLEHNMQKEIRRILEGTERLIKSRRREESSE